MGLEYRGGGGKTVVTETFLPGILLPAITPTDEHFMRRALALASATVGLASPNPQVGCVLVRDNQILGEGAHLYDRLDHAEIAALHQAAAHGHSPAGSTAYVTLEPCSHQGRTGPCALALIAARIARCVIATEDPNPQVAGRGIALLRQAGIAVTLGVLQPEARRLNDPFAHFIQHRRPFVTLKAALSVDGKLAPAPVTRTPSQPHWLTGPAARADVHRLRHAADAILTGVGTLLADDPTLTDRSGLPRRRPLLRVLLDPHLRTRLTAKLVQSASKDVLILCTDQAPPPKAAALRAAGVDIEHLPAHEGRLSLPAVLATLADRDLLSLLLEAGSTLNGAFLQQDLVDQVLLFYTETELGESALPFANGFPSPYLLEQRLHNITRTPFSNGPTEDVRITGYLHDPWHTLP